MMNDEELPLGETCSPESGVLVQRRSFLAVASLALAATPLRAADRLRPRTKSVEPWTVEEFVAEAVPVAKQLIEDGSIVGQDRYLHTLATFAVRLGAVPFPATANDLGKGHWIGSNFAGDPFVVLHWKLAPGAVIRPHPHLYGNVVTLGLEGLCRVSNYEVVGAPDFESKESFRVQLKVDQLLSPGDINLVNLDRNYIHGFRAGEQEVRGLDITTRIRPKRPTPSLSIAGTPVDPENRIFEARWE